MKSGYIFMVSCWEGNTISGVLGTRYFLQGIFIKHQMIQQIWRSNSHRTHQKNFSVEVMVLWGAGCCHPKQRSQRVGKNYLAFHSTGCSVPVSWVIIFGEKFDLKGIILLDSLQEVLYNYAQKLSLCDSGVWFF